MPEVAKDDIEAIRKLMDRYPKHKEDIRHTLHISARGILLSSSPQAAIIFAGKTAKIFEDSLSFSGEKALSQEDRTLAMDVMNMAVLLESNTREELEVIKDFLENYF